MITPSIFSEFARREEVFVFSVDELGLSVSTSYRVEIEMGDAVSQASDTDEQALFRAEQEPRQKLCDHIDHSWETRNLAEDPDMQAVLENLRGKLERRIEDPHPDLGRRDKGAVSEIGARLFMIRQNGRDPSLVDMVTSVDNIDGRS